MNSITVVLPEKTVDEVADSLVELTERVCRATGSDGSFGLGGQFGYGEDFENDVFTMRRFYWGDCTCGFEEAEWAWCDSNLHSETCYQTALRKAKMSAGWTVGGCLGLLNPPEGIPYNIRQVIENRIYKDVCKQYGLPMAGCAIHCTCDYMERYNALFSKGHDPACKLVLPNFRHKATGAEIRWYKYIGRGMEVDDADWSSIFAQCRESLPHRPSPENP